MAWQSQPVRVSADGSAEIEMDLPDFNGKLRWMAVVYSDQAYGHADAETTVVDKLVVQLSRPRFMAVGDQSVLSLDLNNQSGAEQSLDLRLTAEGGLTATERQTAISLADKQKTTVLFSVAAQKSGQGKVSLTVKSDGSAGNGIALENDWTVDIRSAYPAVTRKAQQVIGPEQSWEPEDMLEGLDRASVTAQLTLSSQPLIDADSHLNSC